MIIDNNKYEITEEYNIKNYKKNKLEIKLKGINNITNMSYMFSKYFIFTRYFKMEYY